ncbi:MAG: hypothetical protein EHM89_03270, partial [Acidobacteria bacterium]
MTWAHVQQVVCLRAGDWGSGVGDWGIEGLGWGLALAFNPNPTPTNPQSPTPNPRVQCPLGEEVSMHVLMSRRWSMLMALAGFGLLLLPVPLSSQS